MQSTNRVIVVKGIGKHSATPDLIVLQMNLEVVQPQYDQTMQCAAKALDALRLAITSAGHDGKNLKTTRFKIDTKHESRKVRDEWKDYYVGYACEHGLSLEFDFDMAKLGATLDAIAKYELAPNTIHESDKISIHDAIIKFQIKPKIKINFSIKNPDAVSERLLQNAIENAKNKAGILAQSAGVKLGVIQRIDYNWEELQIYSKTDYSIREEMCLSDRCMEITPEDIDVSDTVTVVWEII